MSLAEKKIADAAQLPQFFHDWIASGEPLIMHSPIDAPETAAALQAMVSEIPEHLRHLIPSPGTVFEIWSPELSAESWEQVQLLLDEIERQR